MSLILVLFSNLFFYMSNRIFPSMNLIFYRVVVFTFGFLSPYYRNYATFFYYCLDIKTTPFYLLGVSISPVSGTFDTHNGVYRFF